MLPDDLVDHLSTPSKASFDAVCSRLREASPSEQSAWRPDLELALEAWPASERQVPELWAKAFLKSGQTTPLWRLARTLELSVHPHQFPMPDVVLDGLEKSTDISQLSLLRLYYMTFEEPELLRRFASIENLRGLVDVTLCGAYLQDRVLPELAHMQCLGGLLDLDLGWNQLEGKSLSSVLCSPNLNPALSKLWLNNNRLYLEGIEALASAENLSSLETLSLFDNSFGAQGIELLIRIPHLAGLQHLELDLLHFQDAGALILARAPHLGNLTSLFLQKNGIGDAGALALANAPITEGLKLLSLSDNDISEGVKSQIRTMERFANTKLDL